MKKFLETKKNRYIFYPLSIFVFFQILNLVVINFAGIFIPSTNLFIFTLNDSIFRYFGNFDGEHYYNIVTQGYALYEQAFFPLYPILIKTFSIGIGAFFSGILISNICFLAFLIVFYKILSEELSERNALFTILFIVFFPTSFYFVSYYTEGLFSLLFILTIYFLRKNKYFPVILTAYLAGLTKIIGVFLIIPIFIYLIYKYKKFTPTSILALFAPILGLVTYCVYLYKTYGDFLMFLNVQPGFGANRSTSIILFPQVIYRYIKIIFTAKLDFIYFISVVEVIVFSVFLIVLLWQLYYLFKNRNEKIKGYVFLLAINLFSLANLILPTLSGTFSSIPRYALMSLSFFIALSFIKYTWIKILLLIIFLIFHIILFAFFTRGYFIS